MNKELKTKAAFLKLGMAVKKANMDMYDAIADGLILGSAIHAGNAARDERPGYADAEIAARINDPVKRERTMNAMADAARVHDGRMGRAGNMVTGGILGGMTGHLAGAAIGRALVNDDDSAGKKWVKGILPIALSGPIGAGTGILLGNKMYKRNRARRRERYLANLRDKVNALRMANMEQ